jgi:hypothetical protein
MGEEAGEGVCEGGSSGAGEVEDAILVFKMFAFGISCSFTNNP